jgi:hypothetical protein
MEWQRWTLHRAPGEINLFFDGSSSMKMHVHLIHRMDGRTGFLSCNTTMACISNFVPVAVHFEALWNGVRL